MASAARTSRHVRLVEEIRCRIERIMEAIHRIKTSKRHVQDEVSEVKSKIQTGVSSQLSAIRDREAWLLDQVDQQCRLKVDAFTTHGENLQQSLGQLRGLLQVSTDHLDDEEDCHEGVDSQIDVILDSTKGDDLRPVTAPQLHFKVDNAALLRAIHNYGSVDPNGLPFDSSVHPVWISSSLPRAIEEYDDLSHHVLYKTLADVRQSQCNDNSIQVAVPRLHPGTWDWLYPPSCLDPCPESCRRQPTEHSVSRWNVPCSLSHLSDSGSSGSLKQWLLDIQNEADNDDNDGDFELIACSTDQSEESNISSRKNAALPLPDTMTVFQEVTKSPSSSWLQNTSTNVEDPASSRVTGLSQETDPITAPASMADWINVTTASQLPMSVCQSHDALSTDTRLSKRGAEMNVMHDAPMDQWTLDHSGYSPSADLLYFHHFAVVLDSPSSDWLQHNYVPSSLPSSCRHEWLELHISDWLMLQSNHAKEVPV